MQTTPWLHNRSKRALQGILRRNCTELSPLDQRQQQNLSEQYRKAFPQLMSSYGRRGLAGPNVKSGIVRSGLSELAKKQIADYGDLQQDTQQQMRQYDLQSAMREADLYGGFSDLEAQKARQIAEDAQILLARRAGAY